MNKEKLREEFKKLLVIKLDYGQLGTTEVMSINTKHADQIADWWLNKLLEHDRELIKKTLHKIYHAESLSDAYEKVKSLLALDEETK